MAISAKGNLPACQRVTQAIIVYTHFNILLRSYALHCRLGRELREFR